MSRKRLKKSIKKKKNVKGKARERKRKRAKKVIGKRDGTSGRSKKIPVSVFFVILIILIAIFSVQYLHRPEREDWTVMIYMAGDNSLSPIVDQNLEAMEEIGSNEHLDIVVLVDKSGNQDSHLFYVKKGGTKELPISNIGVSGLNEVDTGKPDTLSDFGRYAIKKYPSKNYMLIIWGHGKGWQGMASDRDGSILTMPEFSSALADIIDANEGKKLEIIGFDACVMATIEGFFEVSRYAEILVASQKKEPDAGWPYERILKGIASGKYNSPEDIAKNMVKEYVRAYEKGDLPSQGFTVGMTAIKTKKDNDLYVAFQRFANVLNNLPPSEKEMIFDLKGEVETYEDPDNADLRDFVERIEALGLTNQQLTLAIQDLYSAIDSVILKEGHWNNPESDIEISTGGGICLYFPVTSFNSDYSGTALAEVCSWDEFLG